MTMIRIRCQIPLRDNSIKEYVSVLRNLQFNMNNVTFFSMWILYPMPFRLQLLLLFTGTAGGRVLTFSL